MRVSPSEQVRKVSLLLTHSKLMQLLANPLGHYLPEVRLLDLPRLMARLPRPAIQLLLRLSQVSNEYLISN
jgi:hypothetical protein